MGDTIEFHRILHIVWRKLWLIILGTVLVTAIALAVSKNMQPIYRAKVTIKVDQPTNTPLSFGSLNAGESLALTYSKLLKTRPLLETTIKSLDLDMSPDTLRENLATTLIPQTPLIELTVDDTDAQRAANIANEIVSTFISIHNEENQFRDINSFEQDVISQLGNLKELMERNQASINQPATPETTAAQGAPVSPLQSTLASQQSTYANLLSTYLDIQLTQSQFFNVDIVEPAVAPIKPIRPQIPLSVFLGACLGLTLSVGLVFILEFLDRSLKTDEDIKRVLAQPTLGIIPQLRSAERDSILVTWKAPHSVTSEAFRMLRTNIRFVNVDKSLSVLLISSAEPEAGKTTIAANLAILCAQAGLRVIVMDADLRLPSLHRAFRLNNVIGLTDLLISDADNVDAYVQETEIDNLGLIASGPIPPNPAELLGSKRMEEVLESLRACTDLVIIDAPPVLPVTDAAVLAPKADGILFVVRANKTQREAARRAVEYLAHVGGKAVGIVLNAVPRPKDSSDYYYSRKEKGREKRFTGKPSRFMYRRSERLLKALRARQKMALIRRPAHFE